MANEWTPADVEALKETGVLLEEGPRIRINHEVLSKLIFDIHMRKWAEGGDDPDQTASTPIDLCMEIFGRVSPKLQDLVIKEDSARYDTAVQKLAIRNGMNLVSTRILREGKMNDGTPIQRFYAARYLTANADTVLSVAERLTRSLERRVEKASYTFTTMEYVPGVTERLEPLRNKLVESLPRMLTPAFHPESLPQPAQASQGPPEK